MDRDNKKREGECKRRKGRKERKKIKAHTKDFSDSALTHQPSPAPSLPPSSPCKGETPSTDPSPGPRDAGQSRPPSPRRSPGRAGLPEPRCLGAPDSPQPREKAAPRRLTALRGGPELPQEPPLPALQGEMAPGGWEGLVRRVPSASLRLPAAERSRTGQRGTREGGWRSSRARSWHTCLPDPRSRTETARKRQRAGDQRPPTPGVPLAPLRTRGLPAPETLPNSFKVVLSPWALQRR